jgi:hypothetical protein
MAWGLELTPACSGPLLTAHFRELGDEPVGSLPAVHFHHKPNFTMSLVASQVKRRFCLRQRAAGQRHHNERAHRFFRLFTPVCRKSFETIGRRLGDRIVWFTSQMLDDARHDPDCHGQFDSIFCPILRNVLQQVRAPRSQFVERVRDQFSKFGLLVVARRVGVCSYRFVGPGSPCGSIATPAT